MHPPERHLRVGSGRARVPERLVLAILVGRPPAPHEQRVGQPLPAADGLRDQPAPEPAHASRLERLPPVLQRNFAILTAYNPRSMLLPRRVNDVRHQVMRDLLILGCYRVEHCVGYEEEPEGVWREPAWVVHGIERDESIDFGRTFRQNTIVYCQNARPELIVTDPTCDEIGRTFQGNWRVRQ